MKHDIYFAIPGDLSQLTGGYGYDRRITSELKALGHKVHYVALSPTFPKPIPDALQAADLSFSGIPDGAVLLIDGLALGALDDIVAKHKYRLKLIGLCHHPLALETGLDSADVYSLGKSEARALSIVDRVITTSLHTANVLKSDYGVPGRKLATAVPGTDPVSFAPCKGNPPRILTVATLTRRKAHDVLINALAGLKQHQWEAHFVGPSHVDPAWTHELLTLIDDNDLNERIHIHGPVADVSKEYEQADLFVLPSLYEGYGMVFAEALAYGLPIVGAAAGAVPDLVSDTAGILVKPNDCEALRAALETLLASSERRQALQSGAQACAKHLPTWRDSAVIISKIIEDTLKS